MQGGRSGKDIVPGNATQSTLLKRITDPDSAHRMPQDRDALSDRYVAHGCRQLCSVRRPAFAVEPSQELDTRRLGHVLLSLCKELLDMRLPLMSEEASTVMLIHPAPGAYAKKPFEGRS